MSRKIWTDFDDNRQCILLWKACLLEKNEEKINICFYHEQLFGKAVEKNTHKCCGVSKYHKLRVSQRCQFIFKWPKKLKEYKELPRQKLC